MLTLDSDPEEIRKKTRETISLLSKNEFIGLILTMFGDNDPRKIDIWSVVEPLFINDGAHKYPTPHPIAFVEMGKIAKERRKLEKGESWKNED
jgi:hypothetical protein